jgi:hypothetical protein
LFAYRLAKDLGLTVQEVFNKISIAEFKGWAAFYKLEADETKKAMRRR